MSRLFGVLLFAAGVAIVVVDPHQLHYTLLTLPSGLDVHLSDIAGILVFALGIVLFWR
jgi:hypothetical protein